MISGKIKEEFSKIQEFFKKFVTEIKKIFGLIIDKFKIMINEIVKISKIVANFGETFYNKYLKPIFFEIFGAMKEVFKFIWNELIPILKKLIRFIIYDLPILIKKSGELVKRFTVNFYNAPLVSILLLGIVFLGMQVYMKHLLNTELTIPHLLLFFFSFTILWDQLMNHTDIMTKYQHVLTSFLVSIFKIEFMKKTFGLSANFGKDILKSIQELVISFYRNPTKIILGTMIVLAIIKILLTNIYNYISLAI